MSSNHTGQNVLDSSRIVQPSSSRAVQQMSLEDKLRRETFKMAYFTEIGAISRLIDISEFHDLVICAGIDIDRKSIQHSWPNDKNEISMDEAYRLFSRLPNLEFKIKHTLETIRTNDDCVPYDYLVDYAKRNCKFKDEKKFEQFIQMLNDWKMEGVTASQALRKFSETKAALRDINKALTDRAKQQSTSRSSGQQTTNQLADKKNENIPKIEHAKEAPNEPEKNRDEIPTPKSQQNTKVMGIELSDSGDYTSVFIDDHNDELGSYDVPYESGGRYSHDTMSLAQRPFSDRRLSTDIETKSTLHMFTITRKGLVLQKRDGKDASIGHVFTLNEVKTIQIQAFVNSKLDPDLNRFENAMVGVLQSITGQLIIITTRKDGRRITTDRCTLLPGSYIFYVKFCRKQQIRARNPFDSMFDNATGKLSSKYRVCVMNIFDMFDFNDDQVLDINEFKLYNLLNGSGVLTDDLWEALIKTFDTRDNGLTIKAFVDMHQYELDSYEDKTELKDMWFSLTELGFDEHFQFAETCPILVEYHSTDDEIFIDKYDREFWEKTNQNDLMEFFWNCGEKIPYMKDYSLKLWSCEYFAVLIAGPTPEPTRYHLRLDGSKNVNLDVDKNMIIDKTVSPNVHEILLVGIAVDCSRDWFISVRRASKVSTTSQMTPISA